MQRYSTPSSTINKSTNLEFSLITKHKVPKIAIAMSIVKTNLLLLIFVACFFSILLPADSRSTEYKRNIEKWCATTPHPESCKYFISHTHSHHKFNPKHRSEFRKISVRISLERAVDALKFTMKFGPNKNNARQVAAWSDCLKLYRNTVLQLNRTLQGLTNYRNLSCTNFDAQTWLSTALTNIATCRTSGADLNVTHFIDPITTSNNVSELISNSLAVNGFMLGETSNYTANEASRVGMEEYFPVWVSKGETKLLQSSTVKADVVVAKDGSGNYKTVQAAIDAAARRKGRGKFVIYIKRGVYKENIEVGNNNIKVVMIGDGMKYTIITSSRSVGGGYTTYSSATAGIDGVGFVARGITFMNTAGPKMGQAVALRSSSDLSVFYKCAFHGYQDTLMVLSQRQFYRECYIYGTIDFIFGNAAVVFQNCLIYVKRPLKGQVNVITAQGRDDPYQNTGISLHGCQVRAAPDLKPVMGSFKTYLGRPWRQYSRTVVLKSYIDSVVSPVGWLPWDKSSYALDTLYYGEYQNFGPRASTKYRVRWKGFHVITSPTVAASFTVARLIAGQSWLPGTGVPFRPNL